MNCPRCMLVTSPCIIDKEPNGCITMFYDCDDCHTRWLHQFAHPHDNSPVYILDEDSGEKWVCTVNGVGHPEPAYGRQLAMAKVFDMISGIMTGRIQSGEEVEGLEHGLKDERYLLQTIGIVKQDELDSDKDEEWIFQIARQL